MILFKITISVSISDESPFTVTITEMPVEKETKEGFKVRYSDIVRVINKKQVNKVIDKFEDSQFISYAAFADKKNLEIVKQYVTTLISDTIVAYKSNTETLIKHFNEGIRKHKLLEH